LGPIDAHNLDSVSRPNPIHIVVIANDSQRMGSLPLRHKLRQLLEFDVLLVCKLTQVMYNFEGILVLTISAF